MTSRSCPWFFRIGACSSPRNQRDDELPSQEVKPWPVPHSWAARDDSSSGSCPRGGAASPDLPDSKHDIRRLGRGGALQPVAAGHDCETAWRAVNAGQLRRSPLLVRESQIQRKIHPSRTSQRSWFNYGGDKLWPLPEGHGDEQHWPGPVADQLDDGAYDLKTISQAPACAVRLDGPVDPRTGLQYSREISLRSDSPEILFHAVMKNTT